MKLFTCKRFSESHGRQLDGQDISLLERFRYRLHYYLCLYCRRYAKQVDFLDRASRQVCSRVDCCDASSETDELPSQLSPAAKERIKSNLEASQ